MIQNIQNNFSFTVQIYICDGKTTRILWFVFVMKFIPHWQIATLQIWDEKILWLTMLMLEMFEFYSCKGHCPSSQNVTVSTIFHRPSDTLTARKILPPRPDSSCTCCRSTSIQIVRPYPRCCEYSVRACVRARERARVCVCVCLSVCLSVCLWSVYLSVCFSFCFFSLNAHSV